MFFFLNFLPDKGYTDLTNIYNILECSRTIGESYSSLRAEIMDHYTSEPRLYSSLYPHGIHQSLFLLDDAQL